MASFAEKCTIAAFYWRIKILSYIRLLILRRYNYEK